MEKINCGDPYNAMLYSSEKTLTTVINISVDESQKHNAESSKSLKNIFSMIPFT